MRAMLAALHGVLDGLARQARQDMATAAAGGGTRIAVDTDPEVAEQLPPEFIALGTATHEAFDSLASSIEGGASRDLVVERLSRLTGYCVTCHSSYRLETRP